MYYYEDYLRLRKEYFPNVKSIKEIEEIPVIKINKEIVFQLKQSKSSCEFIFDRVGRLLFFKKLDSVYSYLYKYDEMRLISIDERCGSRVSVLNKISYDINNRIIEEDVRETVQGDDSILEKISYNYRDKNIIRIEKSCKNKKDNFNVTEVYNDSNLLISNKLEDDNEVLYFGKFEYDIHGREIKDIEVNADGSYSKDDIKILTYYDNGLIKSYNDSITYEYKYDEKGNWIECFRFNEGVLQYIKTRELIYY